MFQTEEVKHVTEYTETDTVIFTADVQLLFYDCKLFATEMGKLHHDDKDEYLPMELTAKYASRVCQTSHHSSWSNLDPVQGL